MTVVCVCVCVCVCVVVNVASTRSSPESQRLCLYSMIWGGSRSCLLRRFLSRYSLDNGTKAAGRGSAGGTPSKVPPSPDNFRDAIGISLSPRTPLLEASPIDSAGVCMHIIMVLPVFAHDRCPTERCLCFRDCPLLVAAMQNEPL